MLIPFVFIALAFLSEHPRAPGAVVKAMGLCLLVGIPVSAVAGDAVTGIVAGVGAGGIVALRSDEPHNWKARALGVAIAASYTFVLGPHGRRRSCCSPRRSSRSPLSVSPITSPSGGGSEKPPLHDRLDDRPQLRRVRRQRA